MRLNSLKMSPHLIIKHTENNSTNSSQFFVFPMYRKIVVRFYTFTQGISRHFSTPLERQLKIVLINERLDVGRNLFAGNVARVNFSRWLNRNIQLSWIGLVSEAVGYFSNHFLSSDKKLWFPKSNLRLLRTYNLEN